MPTGILNEKQLAMVTRVLDVYCDANNITDPDTRLDLGEVLLRLFDRGARTELQLRAGLEETIRANGLIDPRGLRNAS